MILEVFIDFFGVKIIIGWSKNICNLIIVFGFNFGANMIVRSSLNRSDQSITVRSSYNFKSGHLDIFQIYPDISRYISIYLRYFYRYFRYISDILPIFPIYL